MNHMMHRLPVGILPLPFYEVILANDWVLFDQYLVNPDLYIYGLVNQRNLVNRRAPLHCVIEATVDPYMAIKLIEKGAIVDRRDLVGTTPLMLAAQLNRTTILLLLLNRRADPAMTDNSGDTPLHKAAVSSHIEAILPLLRGGAGINAQNAQGNTPLHLARRAGVQNNESMPFANRLIILGADPAILNQNGQTAEQFSVANQAALAP